MFPERSVRENSAGEKSEQELNFSLEVVILLESEAMVAKKLLVDVKITACV